MSGHIITPDEIVFYPPDKSTGGLDLALLPLAKTDANLFDDMTVEAGTIYFHYRKVIVYNKNDADSFLHPTLSIVQNPLPGNPMFSIALTVPGSPLPIDGETINVNGGNGPGDFATDDIELIDVLRPLDYTSFWIKLFILSETSDTLYINFLLKLAGISGDP
jgi:hypothetical protein